MGAKEPPGPSAQLQQRSSAFMLDQLLAGGLLGSPRSSLEKSEHARRLATPPLPSLSPPLTTADEARPSRRTREPLQPAPPVLAPEAPAAPSSAFSASELEGPMPIMSAFAGASSEPSLDAGVLSHLDTAAPTPRLNMARASTDSALDIPGLLPSAFASVAYADAFKPKLSSFRWDTKQEDAEPPQAQPPRPVIEVDNLENCLPGIPAQHTCPCNTQVGINPTLWRHFDPPYRLMVHLGIHTTLIEGEVTLPLGIYSSLNPRIVTTGMPTRRFHPYQRRASSVGIMTRGAAAAATSSSNSNSHGIGGGRAERERGGLKLRKSGSMPLMGAPAPPPPPPARRERSDFQILEVVLLKRDALTHELCEQWHADHPAIDGGTLINSPVWPGTWVIDIVCRMTDGLDHDIWLKALDRTIAASPEASFIHQFSL